MKSALRAAVLASRLPTNRFVRFAYRRPPPWPAPATPVAPPPDLPPDLASWPQLTHAALPLTPVPTAQDPALVPSLSHGMHVVLRGDGLYPLEAPGRAGRAGRVDGTVGRRGTRGARAAAAAGVGAGAGAGVGSVFYADSLRKIVPPERIAWERIPGYVPAAEDARLHGVAAETRGVRFCSSTSSISPGVAAMYHLLSNFRNTELVGGLSARCAELPGNFAKMHRKPVALVVRRVKVGSESGKDVFSVNAHSGPEDGPSILSSLGHSMERMLTTAPEEFAEQFVRADDGGGDEDLVQDLVPRGSGEQFYHYSQAGPFLLRAQIDCRNAATGEVFDVKTRAIAPIRYDLPNYTTFQTHRVRYLHGRSDSYEREFYDMVRSVFLKYALQLRIGRMHGALVAYHNTTEVLGLEYIPLREIEAYVFGSQAWADVAFGTALRLLERALDQVTTTLLDAQQPDDDSAVKVVLSTEWSRLKMYIFAQKLSRRTPDPFNAAAFARASAAGTPGPAVTTVPHSKPASPPAAALCASGQWHFDSYLHNKRGGVALVAPPSHARHLGGEQLPCPSDAAAAPGLSAGAHAGTRRASPGAYDHRNFPCNELTPERFRVWELDVAPLINEERAPRHVIRLESADRFRLKYRLREVDCGKEHHARFVAALGRVYFR